MCKRCIGCGWKCRVGQEGAEERSKKGVLPMNLPWKLPKISRHSCSPPNTHHRGCVWGAEKRYTDKTFFQGLKRLSVKWFAFMAECHQPQNPSYLLICLLDRMCSDFFCPCQWLVENSARLLFYVFVVLLFWQLSCWLLFHNVPMPISLSIY